MYQYEQNSCYIDTFSHNNFAMQSPNSKGINMGLNELDERNNNYNQILPSELEKIQRSPNNLFYNSLQIPEAKYRNSTEILQNKNTFFQKNNSSWDKIPKQQNKNHIKTESSPKWWRQESSFEGWGFD